VDGRKIEGYRLEHVVKINFGVETLDPVRCRYGGGDRGLPFRQRVYPDGERPSMITQLTNAARATDSP
jgi:hypothetical protein